MQNIDHVISRAIIGLLIHDPFFAHLISSIPREMTDRTPTLAVELTSGGVRMLVNEQFFMSLPSDQQRMALIKHEALHLAFSHCGRRLKGQCDELFDLAADMVVNQFVPRSELPTGVVSLEDLGLKPNDTVENYYQALLKLGGRKLSSNDQDAADGSGNSSAEGDGTTNPSASNSGEKPETLALRNALQQKIQLGDHQFWGTADAGINYDLENLLIQAKDRTPISKRDSIPAPIADLIEVVLQQRGPQIDWRRRLRLFGSSSRRTRVVQTVKRKSKRYGVRPGLRIKRFQKLLVAIDTSGSVDEAALELFFNEVKGMWHHGSEVTIIECDCEVRRVSRYQGITPSAVAGGGGTDFNPVFDFVRNHQRARFDGIVYLTDGYAEKPTIRPHCRLLWVLTPDGTSEHLAFGQSVKLS